MTTRRLGSETLVIATHNAGKLKEIAALLDTPHFIARAHRHAADRRGDLLAAVRAADSLKSVRVGVMAFQHGVGGAQRRFNFWTGGKLVQGGRQAP